MAEITGVTFKEGGKVYYFSPCEGACKEGGGVIVETARGLEYGTVVIPRAEVDESKLVSPLKPVLRVATAKDEEIHRKNLEKKDGALAIVREKVEKLNLDMKLIDCEFTFDGAKAVFYFSAPQRVDFRELVKELSAIFHTRIEMRQVGIRDEIKILGGLAPCGRECCCSGCMPEIKKVSIKMAKNQGLSLNPGKISGLCGRLMCCLSYENDYYAEACKKMPKLGGEVATPEGKGIVVNVNMLSMTVRVKIEDKQKDIVTFKDFKADELKFKCPHRLERDDEDNEPAETETDAAESDAEENWEEQAATQADPQIIPQTATDNREDLFGEASADKKQPDADNNKAERQQKRPAIHGGKKHGRRHGNPNNGGNPNGNPNNNPNTNPNKTHNQHNGEKRHQKPKTPQGAKKGG